MRRHELIGKSRFIGVDQYVVFGRLKNGWSVGEAICVPTGAKRRAA